MNITEQNPKLGYYQVGDQRFYVKPEAYIYATQTNQIPIWNFNNVEFAKFDWTNEPELDIRELYRIRAQQLRDRYDYIRLDCSGGSDSATVAFSFLLNNIHLDEIVFRYPKAGEKGVTDDPYNFSPTNTLSEWRYAAKPLLDWVKTNYPNTIVTIHDYSENMFKEDYMKDESWIFTTKDWFQPGHGIKHTQFGTAEHRQLVDSGKSVCSLHGIDKPKLFTIGNDWYVYFLDVQANHPSPIVNGYTNITNELFYWTPDMPEIVCKQSHMIKRWLDMPQNQHLKDKFTHPYKVTVGNRTMVELLIKSIIYPDYDQHTWQTSKPTNSFYNEMDHWFYTNYADTSTYSVWQNGLKFLVDKIDPKYIRYRSEEPVGLSGNYSLFYYMGTSDTLSSTKNTPMFNNNGNAHFDKGEYLAVKDQKIKKLVI